MSYDPVLGAGKFFFRAECANAERDNRQSRFGQQMHHAGMRMMMTLISHAEIGMSINLYNAEAFTFLMKRIKDPHYRAIAHTMFAAKCYRNMPLCADVGGQVTQVLHHLFNRLSAIHLRMRENTLLAWLKALHIALQLVAGLQNSFRPFAGASAVRYCGL